MANIKIIYDFLFPDKTSMAYTIEIDRETLRLVPAENSETARPEWARLENKKCGHCPLNEKKSPYCPVASNISELVEAFKNKTSYSEVAVKVSTVERVYVKKVPVQDAIFSILGLEMATSACPYTDFLKPMARFHLPFSTSEETIVRSVSMYLLRQYFVAKKGGKPDMDLKKLEEHYNNLQKVNTGIIARIRAITAGDADVNAITVLHSFASLLTMAIGNDLNRIEPLFSNLK